MRDLPKSGQLYRHFKGNIYRIITVAKHSETGERLVIYKRDDADEDNAYARPLEMFLSEVDRRKYPDVREKYRFTLCSEDVIADLETGGGVSGEASGLDPLLEAFLDADTISEKVERFYDMRIRADEAMLDYVAASIEIDIAGTRDEKYSEILRALKAKEKYESNRLRR